jgi:predicted nuclease with TOPRIM domain
MRKKFIEMTEKMKEYNDNIKSLTGQVNKLNDENLKLNSDIKVIRVEHSEMLHTIHKLENKNEKLI